MKKFYITLVCAIALFIGVGAQAEMAGLVGAWLFDEGSGTIAADSSNNGHDGELVGNASWEPEGKYGSALYCDGTEAYVAVPDHEDFEFDGDFSLVCWVQNEVPPSNHSAFITKGYHRPSGSGGDARPWYLVYFLTTGTVDFFLRDTGGTNSRASGKTPVNDGKWHHVACVKTDEEVLVYIDGKQDASAPVAAEAKYGQNDQPLVFMVHFDRWIKGLLDEVAVFNRAVSESEIQTIMQGLEQNVLAVSPRGRLPLTWGNLKSQ